MGYALGIDLGTTYTAAATFRDGRVEIANLGNRAAAVPSVVLLREDETVLTGEAADRRGVTEPERVAREFKRRLGDTTPIFVGGTPYSAEALMARLLRSVVDEVVSREGGEPDAVAVSHPANWGPYKTDLLGQAVRLAELPGATLLTEPEAAALHYASTERVEPGSVIAVYDLGGGTFDAAVLRKTQDGFEVLGEPEGIERLGGVDFDAAVFAHVARALDGALEQLDEDDPAALAAVARLRQECVEAKEALSTDTDVSIPVLLPNVQTEVRLTRTEFEAMVRPALSDSIDALRRAMRSAEVEPADLEAVVLIGGSSRIPLVSQLVSGEVGRPVAIDTHPKHAVALGTARRAAIDAGMAGAGLLGGETAGDDAGASSVGPAAAGAAAGAAVGAAGAALAGAGGEEAAPEAAATAAAPTEASAAPVQPTPQPTVAEQAASTPSLPYASQTPPPPPAQADATQQNVVVPPQPPEQPPPVAARPARPDETKRKNKKKRKGGAPIGVVVVGVVVILALAGGIAWALTSGDDAPSTDDLAAGSGADEDEDAGEQDSCLTAAIEPRACITELAVAEDGRLIARFDTFGFTPQPTTTGSEHVHFFFSSFETGEFNQATAGRPVGDPGNWTVWETPADFDQLTLQEARGFGADVLCVVVATAAHESVLDTGNCAAIPGG